MITRVGLVVLFFSLAASRLQHTNLPAEYESISSVFKSVANNTTAYHFPNTYSGNYRGWLLSIIFSTEALLFFSVLQNIHFQLSFPSASFLSVVFLCQLSSAHHSFACSSRTSTPSPQLDGFSAFVLPTFPIIISPKQRIPRIQILCLPLKVSCLPPSFPRHHLPLHQPRVLLPSLPLPSRSQSSVSSEYFLILFIHF